MATTPLQWISGKIWERAVRELGSEDASLQRAAVTKWEQRADARLTGQRPGRPLYYVLQGARMILNILPDDSIGHDEPVDDIASFAVCEYLRHGRQTFAMSPGLADELTLTDVDDVPYEELALPYEAFYLDLSGLVADAQRGGTMAGVIAQRFTYADSGASTLAITPFVRTDGTIRPLMTIRMRHEKDDTVPQALRRTVDHEIDNAHKINMIIHCAPGMGKRVASLKDDPKEAAARTAHIDGVVESAAAIETILPLLANAMLYIDQCGGSVKRVWPQDAPIDLVAKADGGGTGARKAIQKLTAMGHTRISKLELDEEADGGGTRGQTERGGPRAHWRRGHWRRQRHGPGATLFKRIRIRPVMVGHGADPRDQRTYDVDRAA